MLEKLALIIIIIMIFLPERYWNIARGLGCLIQIAFFSYMLMQALFDISPENFMLGFVIVFILILIKN